MKTEFRKYNNCGAYHWLRTHDAPIWRLGVRLLARYDLAARWVRKLVLHPASGLDIGCGDGFLIYRLARVGYSTIGVDMSKEGLAFAGRRLNLQGIHTPLIEGTAYELPQGDESQEFVTSVEVIEHLEKPDVALREVYRVLRPGGVFVSTTPQRAPNQPGNEVRDPYHIKEYIATELSDELRTVFDQVDVYGAYPETLDRLYQPSKRGDIVTNGIRLVFRLGASIGMNPYLRCSNPAGPTDQLLVGVARKHKKSTTALENLSAGKRQ